MTWRPSLRVSTRPLKRSLARCWLTTVLETPAAAVSSVTVFGPWDSCQRRCRRGGSASIRKVPAAAANSSAPGVTGWIRDGFSGAPLKARSGWLLIAALLISDLRQVPGGLPPPGQECPCTPYHRNKRQCGCCPAQTGGRANPAGPRVGQDGGGVRGGRMA